MSSARERVAQRQASVLDGIFSGAAPAAVLPTKWLTVAHEAMGRKRAWACAFSWSTTARSLGADEYTRLFVQYVNLHPRPPVGGSFVDGRLFAEQLDEWDLLPDLGKVQSLSFDLRHRIVHGRTQPRRGMKIALRQLRKPRYLVLGLKLPLRHTPSVWRIRVGRRGMKPS